jgi:hypothetical protein
MAASVVAPATVRSALTCTRVLLALNILFSVIRAVALRVGFFN